MIRGLIKLLAYRKAPRGTFALLHPIRALKWGAAFFLVKKLLDGILTEPQPDR